MATMDMQVKRNQLALLWKNNFMKTLKQLKVCFFSLKLQECFVDKETPLETTTDFFILKMISANGNIKVYITHQRKWKVQFGELHQYYM